MTEERWFQVVDRRGFVNISNAIEGLGEIALMQEGLCLVNAMHTTGPDN